MKKLSVVIPCYNELDNLPELLEKLNAIITREDIEIVLVDNGSTDGTKEYFDKVLNDYSFIKRVDVVVNQGYGYGILCGLKACDAEYIGWTHADLQTDTSDIIKALSIIENSNEEIMVKGNRKGRPLSDQFFTCGMSVFETIYLGKNLFDVNAQPNIFPKSFFDKWENPPHDFALDLYVLFQARAKNLPVKRFDVLFPKRKHGSSKWNTGFKSKLKFIKRTLDFSVRLKKEGIK